MLREKKTRKGTDWTFYYSLLARLSHPWYTTTNVCVIDKGDAPVSTTVPESEPTPLTNVVTEHATVTTGVADGTRVVAVTPDTVRTPPVPLPVPSPVANPVPVVSVPYMHPHLRALSAAQRTALASLAAALATLLLRLLYNFLAGGSYTAAAVQSLLLAMVMGSITVLVSYIQKFTEANGDDALKLANSVVNGTSVHGS